MKQSTQSALLYCWLGVGPFLVGELHSDTAKEFIPVLWLWLVTVAVGATNIAAVQLKSFRSTEFGDEKSGKLPLALLLCGALLFTGCSVTSPSPKGAAHGAAKGLVPIP